jgi:Rrf2 family protein
LTLQHSFAKIKPTKLVGFVVYFMNISKKSEYGLTAMVHLASGKNKKAVSIREISNIEKVPFEYLSKIFSILEKAKLVKGKHGMNGGYFLAKPASKISVMDIVEMLENVKTTECSFCLKSKKCPTKNVWQKVDKAVGKTLSSIKLADLVK